MIDLTKYARDCLKETHLYSKESDVEFLTLDELKTGINEYRPFSDSQQRARLVDQAIAVLHGNYVFTHAHAIRMGVDPVAALLRLRGKLVNPDEKKGGTSNWEFFKIVTRIIADIGDPHTAIQVPDQISSYTGFVPLLIEAYFDRDVGKNRYFISHIVDGVQIEQVRLGDEVITLNGETIDEAVRTAESSSDGVFATAWRFDRRNLDQLTIIPLDVSLVDDENAESLKLGLRRNGDTFEYEHVYLFAQLGLRTLGAGGGRRSGKRPYFSDLRSMLFAPGSDKTTSLKSDGGLKREKISNRNNMRIEKIWLDDGEHRKKQICYIRLYALESGDRDRFINNVIKPLESPRSEFDGLIIDIRASKGGSIRLADQLVARCAGKEIEPVKGQLRNTHLNEAYCRKRAKKISAYEMWADSIRTRAAEGLLYSAALPFSKRRNLIPPDTASTNGSIPKLLIVDNNTASAAEVFAAGFADNELGEILGTHPTTAGACSHGIRLNKLLMEFVNGGGYPYDVESTIGRIKLSMCRLVRSGISAGEIIEGNGVRADVIVPLTINDVMNNNQDLLETAITRLLSAPVRPRPKISRGIAAA